MVAQTQLDALFYVITVIFPTWMVAWRMERRDHFAVRCAGWFALMAGMMGAMTYGIDYIITAVPALQPEQLWLYMIKYSATFLLAFVGVKVCFDCDRWGALFCANTGYCLQHIGARIDSIFTDIVGLEGPPWTNPGFAGILIAGLMCALFWALVLRKRPKKQPIQMGSRWQIAIATCVVAITIVYNTIGIRNASELIHLSEKSGIGLTPAWNLLLFVYVMSALIALLALLLELNIRSNEDLSSERDTLNSILENGRQQYEREKANIQLLDLKYHDLKHQLAAMKGKIYEEQIEELTEAVNLYDTSIHTGNEALDVVLTQKAFYCTGHGITLTCLVNGEHYSFIPRHEMYALFNNILDNAIEAVEKLPEEQRVISVTEQFRQGFLSVRVENYCGETPAFQDGLPVSAKEGAGHGFGMKSIRMIVEKNGGGLSVTAEDGMFVLDIYFQRE